MQIHAGIYKGRRIKTVKNAPYRPTTAIVRKSLFDILGIIENKTFLDLFSAKINTYLPEYLTVIYRFLGWWLMTSGLLIIIYLRVTGLGTKLARNSLQMVLFIVLIGLYYFVFSFIPQSPFVPLLYVLTFLLLCSVYFSTRMVK